MFAVAFISINSIIRLSAIFGLTAPLSCYVIFGIFQQMLFAQYDLYVAMYGVPAPRYRSCVD